MVAIGALSGNLAAMLAALLAPRNLATAVAASGSSGSLIPPAPGGTGGQGVPSPNALNPGNLSPELTPGGPLELGPGALSLPAGVVG